MNSERAGTDTMPFQMSLHIAGTARRWPSRSSAKRRRPSPWYSPIPPGFSNDHENSHRGDQLIYVIEGKATCRVSGRECEIKAGDFVTIPAGAPHTLRTGAEKLFALTVFAPPER